jgi:uncharacterized integral membrane protein
METARPTSDETPPGSGTPDVGDHAPDTAETTTQPTTAAPATPEKPTHRTRTSGAWTGVIAGAVVLLLLLIFILENTQKVKISYFGATGHLPLGVGLLLAAVAGALIVGLVGVARVLQLRTRAKRALRQST